jgi:hypothetical protein
MWLQHRQLTLKTGQINAHLVALQIFEQQWSAFSQTEATDLVKQRQLF